MVREIDAHLFWTDSLGSAKYVLAPMVEQSELPWRLLSREYGAQLCYTPMLHASVFIKDVRYRAENLASCEEDRPLIVQFCANDPETFVEAAIIAQDHCEAIDLNLGCPQTIAQRGHYGAFLEDEWDLVANMITSACKRLRVPVTCKIRIFEDINKTVAYAKMLESAGCRLLAVHGRTKEQKGPKTGLASWDHIKAVKANVKIPVFANGNIQCLKDVEDCLLETGVDGVMIAEGNLHNPALFKGLNPTIWDMAEEYLNLVKLYPCPMSCVRGHLFKLCHHCLVLSENHDIRLKLACSKSLNEFVDAIEELKHRYQSNISKEGLTYEKCSSFNLPPWICQPYERPPPKCNDAIDTIMLSTQKRNSPDEGFAGLSKNKRKKMMKHPDRQVQKEKKIYDICTKCSNPKGMKCFYNMCKSCCKSKTSNEFLDCEGHKYFYVHKKNSLKTEEKGS